MYLTRQVEEGIDALDLQPDEENNSELDLDDVSIVELNSDELDLELDEELDIDLGESTYVSFAPKSKVNDEKVQNLILEVQRSLDYYESQLGLGQITQLWLMAGDRDLTDLVDVMQSALTANVEQPNMAETLKKNAGFVIAERCIGLNCVTIALGGALAYEPS